MSCSVLILTLNEGLILPRCLQALHWCDDIVILDSYSTDNSIEIAEAAGARVYQRAFDDFAGQRNFAIDTLSFRHEWIFHLDADEIFTEALRREIMERIAHESFDAYRAPSKMMWGDTWLKHAATYPVYQVRLGRRGRFRFRQVGHGQRSDIDDDSIGTLQSPYLHYSFIKGMGDWLHRHNRYSTQEAHEAVRSMSHNAFEWKSLVSKNPSRRRHSLKVLGYRIPCRPLAKFGYQYLFRLGFLDGIAGFRYCMLQAIYEYMICLKTAELLATRNAETDST